MAPLLSRLGIGQGGFGFGRKKSSSGSSGLFLSATGGTTYTSGDYKLHVFTFPNSDPFNVTTGGAGEILVLAGGGAGSPDQMGGGGAGGVVFTPTPIQFNALNYPISVGSGGPSSPYGSYGSNQKGQNSTFGSSPQNIYLVALGGAGARDQPFPQPYSNNAGCGGGGGNNIAGGSPGVQPSQPQTAPSPVNSTGFPGGGHPGNATSNTNGSGGGGGGAGQAGNHGGPPAPSATRGVGGDGFQVPATFIDPFVPVLPNPFLGIANSSPAFRYFGGGGGGSDNNDNGGTARNTGAPGGLGGGGRGAQDPGSGGIPGTPAVNGRGGGGGGGSTHSGIGGSGGSGCVLIKYKFQ